MDHEDKKARRIHRGTLQLLLCVFVSLRIKIGFQSVLDLLAFLGASAPLRFVFLNVLLALLPWRKTRSWVRPW